MIWHVMDCDGLICCCIWMYLWQYVARPADLDILDPLPPLVLSKSDNRHQIPCSPALLCKSMLNTGLNGWPDFNGGNFTKETLHFCLLGCFKGCAVSFSELSSQKGQNLAKKRRVSPLSMWSTRWDLIAKCVKVHCSGRVRAAPVGVRLVWHLAWDLCRGVTGFVCHVVTVVTVVTPQVSARGFTNCWRCRHIRTSAILQQWTPEDAPNFVLEVTETWWKPDGNLTEIWKHMETYGNIWKHMERIQRMSSLFLISVT